MRLASKLRLAAEIIREDRALARAAKRIPRPIPWEYARPRLVPFLCGPRFDRPGEEIVRATTPPGCAIEFGVDLGGVFPLVDRLVAERWECSAQQLRDVALANLRRRVERLPESAATSGTLSGRIVHMLRAPRGLASSLLLLSDELFRIFGAQDQVFAAPSRSLLMSFPLATPTRVIADAIVEMEAAAPWPLMLDPFLLSRGELTWQPGDDLDDDARGRGD